jgi:hypothetical protein
MPWQSQQPQQPPYQPQPHDRRPGQYRTDPSGQYIWIPTRGNVPGHWRQRRSYTGPRDHRGEATYGTPNPFGSGTISGWYDLTGSMIGAELPPPPGMELLPRAAVVDAPLPTQANRDILPMSTGVPILPAQSAQITGRPQTLVFKIGRFVISNAGTAGGAADWIVNDIKIGNRSQFVQSGDVPGDLFAVNAIDTFVRFEAAQTAMDVVVVVTYIGLNESGCPFFGAMVGTAAV